MIRVPSSGQGALEIGDVTVSAPPFAFRDQVFHSFNQHPPHTRKRSKSATRHEQDLQPRNAKARDLLFYVRAARIG